MTIGLNPVDSRYIQAFGLLDASLNFNLPEGFQISLTASNLADAAQSGVGGDTSWDAVGQPHMQYRTKLTVTRFGFRIETLTGAGTQADKAKPAVRDAAP